MSFKALDCLRNWKLLRGPHKFPGSDGGTCINEAAIVAAGFEYRQVLTWDDLPECFSKVIGAFSIRLNDALSDATRQRLIPYVMRLVGTADSAVVETERAEFLLEEINKLVAMVAKDLNPLTVTDGRLRIIYATHHLSNKLMSALNVGGVAGKLYYDVLHDIVAIHRNEGQIMFVEEFGFKMLDGVLAIGRQAQEPDVGAVEWRVHQALKSAALVGV